MNEYKYSDLSAGGVQASFSRTITAAMLDDFLAISGDVNPLHSDRDFAVESGYPDRVVYGMVTASLYSTLAGVYLPGKYCLLQSVHSDFLAPVFIGDTLTCEGKIVEMSDAFKRIVIKAVIRNQHGKKVSRAKIEAGVLK